jgi:hypothetical protein
MNWVTCKSLRIARSVEGENMRMRSWRSNLLITGGKHFGPRTSIILIQFTTRLSATETGI